SIVLMLASRRMLDVGGAEAAMVAMGTELNLEMLREAGLWDDSLAAAGPDDLILAARGPDPEPAIRAGESALAERKAPAGAAADLPPRTVRSAARRLAAADLAVVSVPGEHAPWVCWDALQSDLNV